MTSIANSKGIIMLIIGDLIAYSFSLVLALTIRYGQIPSRILFMDHIISFSILFVVFIIVSFSAGFYDKQSAFILGKVQRILFQVQIVNFLIGIAFFYFAPVVIAPKANLFLYFIISTIILFIWRVIMFPVINMSRKQLAIIVGTGEDIKDLYDEINTNSRYGLIFKQHIQPQSSVDQTVSKIAEAVKSSGASIIVADLHDKNIESAMPFLYSLIFSGTQIIDASKLYESVFDRIPLSMVGERWLVENSAMALGSRRVYDTLKRLMDIIIAFITGLISLVFYPFVYLAIKLEDKGNVFISQERVGKNGKPILITKFRSMTSDDSGSYGENGGKSILKVTSIGKCIRLTRIDELPQLWSVIKGNQSLIGPRPELPALTKVYEKEIPYYNVRHLIKPGLSGWAQISHQAHPHHAVAVNDTRDKLSYDLYYIKNRSLMLDIRIALQTAKSVLSRQGV
ncbi:MAG: exopolysaccharide biosynthesis polyprenyl glycosylphosphotransferase [Patescibacteria group bacterium]